MVSGVLRETEAAESMDQHFKSKLWLHGVEGDSHLLADGRLYGADRAGKIGRSDDCGSTCEAFPIE
jgi:hypothetical protein